MRWVLGLFLIGLITFISIILSFKTKPQPKINSLIPEIGSPGDLIIIQGENFGSKKGTNFIEISGNKLTEKSVLSWKNDEIKIILPENFNAGLVYVGNKDVKSNPKFFANSTTIPVAKVENPENELPYIENFNNVFSYSPAVGKILTIYGKNFGNTREKAKVYFSSDIESEEKFISANEENFEYKYWSDTEIHIKIPDGAASGDIFIETSKGKSNLITLNLNTKSGSKKFNFPKTYVLKVSVDIENYSNDKKSTIITRTPRPLISINQPIVNLIEYSPEPVIKDFQHTVINQTVADKNRLEKNKFYQNYKITNYQIISKINEKNIQDYSSETLQTYESFLTEDKITFSENEEIVSLAKKIVGKEKNPYRKAKLVYEYFLNNFTLLKETRKDNSSPIDLLNKKTGDAYDFAICYTSILRSLKIPSLTCSGTLVSSDLKAQNHWWNEFYIENVGWLPVDLAIPSGLNYTTWTKDIDLTNFYFGNLDAQHIVFSRGFNEIKPGFSNNKTVYRQRTYALQSIWEESSGEKIKYSSYWAEPVIIGVY